MTADTLTKQCVIIACFSTVLSFVAVLLESQDLWMSLRSDSSRYSYTRGNAMLLTLYSIAALFSILLIRGVVKRQPALMAPWLVCSLGAVAFSIYFILSNLLPLLFGDFFILLPSMAIVGMETVIVYPLYCLCFEIWHEKAEKRKQAEQEQIDYNKKMSAGFVNLNSKIVV